MLAAPNNAAPATKNAHTTIAMRLTIYSPSYGGNVPHFANGAHPIAGARHCVSDYSLSAGLSGRNFKPSSSMSMPRAKMAATMPNSMGVGR